MKSLNKFYCKSAKVELLMRDAKDSYNEKLYLVTEEPRNEKATWVKSNYNYDYSEDAKKKFIELVSFWC